LHQVTVAQNGYRWLGLKQRAYPIYDQLILPRHFAEHGDHQVCYETLGFLAGYLVGKLAPG
jgi:hypothetical protein